eukprot:tig00000655_g2843.t1
MCRGSDFARLCAAPIVEAAAEAQHSGKDPVCAPGGLPASSLELQLFLQQIESGGAAYGIAAAEQSGECSPVSHHSSSPDSQPLSEVYPAGEWLPAAEMSYVAAFPAFTSSASASSSGSGSSDEEAPAAPGLFWFPASQQVVSSPCQSGTSSPCSSTCSSCTSQAPSVPLVLDYVGFSGLPVQCVTSAATRVSTAYSMPQRAPTALATAQPKPRPRAAKPTNVKRRPDPKAPKPTNCFLLFCDEMRPKIKSQSPELKNQEISRMLGEEWSKLPREAKRKYEDEADRIMAERRRTMGPEFGYVGRSRTPPSIEFLDAKRPRLAPF